MAYQFFKQRWQKITLIIFGSITLLIIIAALLINKIAEPILTKKLKEAVLKGSDKLYRIDFSDADLSILRGKVALHNIKLTPDTVLYKTLKQKSAAPDKLYTIAVDKLDVTGIGFFDLYFSKKLHIDAINIITPQLNATQYLIKSQKPADNRPLYQKIKESLKEIAVSEINVDNGRYSTINYTQAKATRSELKKLNLKATGLLIDSATQADTTRTLFCKNVIVGIADYSGKSTDGLYTYTVKSAKLSTQTGQVNVAGLDVQPLKTATFFAKSRDDKFDLHLDSVQIHNFDYRTYNTSNSLNANRITVTKGKFSIFTNPIVTLKKTDRLITFPHWAIRQVKTIFNVDTLVLRHINVMYNEYNKRSKKTGTLTFTNTNARFLNLTNNKEVLKTNSASKVGLTSYFMGKSKLDLSFVFNLTDANYSYSYKGSLAPMEIAVANLAIMPLSLVKVTSGRLKILNFDIHSTQKVSTGKVNFQYNDLTVDVLRQDDKQGYTKNTLLSLFANTFVIKHDNPDDGSASPRSANVVFIRPANFPFFKTVWLTLLSGIKPCAGVGKAQEEKFKKQSAGASKKEQEELLKKAKEIKENEDKAFKDALKKQKKKS